MAGRRSGALVDPLRISVSWRDMTIGVMANTGPQCGNAMRVGQACRHAVSQATLHHLYPHAGLDFCPVVAGPYWPHLALSAFVLFCPPCSVVPSLPCPAVQPVVHADQI
jgi:hypothetical protein